MTDDDTRELLARFAVDRSEDAFRLLVGKHSGLVYSTALRKLAGDQAAAEDVTQEVFTLLANKAAGLGGVVLGGWLYRQTCRRSANHVRTEVRRKRRERIAMEQLDDADQPLQSRQLSQELDDAMLALPAKDRDALVLRYFEGSDYRSVGRSLGISEEAARKRVKRALDRIGGIFGRKGIAIGGASLGTTMSGFGAVPVSEILAGRICSQAMRDSAAPVLAGLLKPVVAGIIATSLVSGITLAVHQNGARENRLVEPVFTASRARERGEPDSLRVLPEDASLETIIAEIKRVQSGPANALTGLRLKSALGRIGIGETAEFITLANEQLSIAERAATYDTVLRRWLAVEPDAAMTFVLLENVGSKVDPWSSTNLLINLFTPWMTRDGQASQAWLMEHWENPVLVEGAFLGSLRGHLSVQIFDELIDHGGKEELFQFIHSIPDEEDRRKAFDSVTGEWPWGNLARYRDAGTGLEAYRILMEIPDPDWRMRVSRKYLKKWAETVPEEFDKAAATMSPEGRFEMSLGRLGARTRPRERVASLSGGYTEHRDANDPVQSEAEAMQAGMDAGLPREQVIQAVGEVLMDRLSADEMYVWLDSHRGEVELDGRMAEEAREKAGSGVTIGDTGPEMAAIYWAARISDSELRARLCRGAFRKLCAREPEDVAAWLERPEVPQDLLPSFHSILEEVR